MIVHMLTYQVLVRLFYIECILCTTFALMFMSYYVRHHKWPFWYLLNNASLCLFNYLSICIAKDEGSAWVSSWTQAQSACLPHNFSQYQIILPFTEAMDCLKVSIYSSAATKSWLHVNVKSSLTPYLLHYHVTSLVCMSVIKIYGNFIRPATVLCGTCLLYQTQHEIRSVLAQDLWMNAL